MTVGTLKYDRHQHCTAVFQSATVIFFFPSPIKLRLAVTASLDCRREEKSQLIVSPLKAPRLYLGASRDLARCEALFNVADAKVPRIQ